MPKMDALKEFLPESVESFIHAQIDLDITNLTISDVLRNFNKAYPRNTIEREQISAGRTVYGVLCKSEYLFPLKGVLLFITGGNVDLNITSRKFAVVSIDESDILTETRIMDVNDNLSVYLAKNYKEYIADFDMFYNRFMYNAYEAERE